MNVNELFALSKSDPAKCFENLDLGNLMFKDESHHSILIDRYDCGGKCFVALVDKRNNPGVQRWWLLAEYIPTNYPCFSICLHFKTDDELREEIRRWLPGEDAIMRDNAGLFDDSDDK
jgi:hypothetical protein